MEFSRQEANQEPVGKCNQSFGDFTEIGGLQREFCDSVNLFGYDCFKRIGIYCRCDKIIKLC